jgi:hypothetical protein
MGYTITIGNAVPEHHKDDFPILSASWEVQGQVLENAPTFENDGMTGASNSRSPSYTDWADFCRATGLYELFFGKEGDEGLMAHHPDCKGITQYDVDIVTASLKKYQAKATLPAGFEKHDYTGNEQNYDYHLARLIWLEFWMRWAIANCETPALENT